MTLCFMEILQNRDEHPKWERIGYEKDHLQLFLNHVFPDVIQYDLTP